MNNLDKQPQTTCEFYHAVFTPELRISVQTALYYYLHSSLFYYPLTKSVIVKDTIKTIINSLNLLYKYKLKKHQKCDVIFSFYDTSANYLGIQKQLARQCFTKGLKTGIIYQRQLADFSDFIEAFPLSIIHLTSYQVQKEIIEQCKLIELYLNKLSFSSNQKNLATKLSSIAIYIEKLTNYFRYFLEIQNPQLVILTNPKSLQEVALQIACKDTGIPSILIPHGFPQRSQYPLASSLVMSYCPHHDKYLEKLSLTSANVKPLGWIEPKANLFDRFEALIEEKSNASQNEKYNVLFLSQISGAKLHRCESLVKRIPDIFKALEQMDEVETITLRLRSNELDDTSIKKILSERRYSKLRISSNKFIADDLKTSNLLMAFSSTGLLYGPYLNMKAIEIRDRTINSVWEETVLPSHQVYQINDHFNSKEFCDFVINSKILQGKDVFYNWGLELESFKKYLDKKLS